MPVWEQWYLYVGTPVLGGIFTFLALCTIQFVWDQMKKIEVRRRK